MTDLTFTAVQKKAIFLAIFCVMFLSYAVPSYAFDLDQDQYLFSANSVAYDSDYSVIVAVGDVEIIGQEEVGTSNINLKIQ